MFGIDDCSVCGSVSDFIVWTKVRGTVEVGWVDMHRAFPPTGYCAEHYFILLAVLTEWKMTHAEGQ